MTKNNEPWSEGVANIIRQKKKKTKCEMFYFVPFSEENSGLIWLSVLTIKLKIILIKDIQLQFFVNKP